MYVHVTHNIRVYFCCRSSPGGATEAHGAAAAADVPAALVARHARLLGRHHDRGAQLREVHQRT